MSDTKVRVKFTADCFHGSHYYVAGDTVTMWKSRADHYVRRKQAAILGAANNEHERTESGADAGDTTPGDADTNGFPAHFPAGDTLTAAGIADVDALRAFVAEHGDGWHTKIKGIGKVTAAEIADALSH